VLGAQSFASRRAARALTAYSALSFAALVFAYAGGALSPSALFTIRSLRGEWAFAGVLVFTGVAALLGLADFQRSFVAVLARSEERQRLLLRTAHDAIFTCDREGRFTAVNRAVERLSGYAPGDLFGNPLERFVVEQDRAILREHLAAAVSGMPQRYELRYARKDGTERFISMMMTPIEEDGAVTGAFCIARDVTEQKQADAERERLRRELSHSEKMTAVGQLVSGVAHELNNPLAAILSFAEELRESGAPSSPEAVEIIHQQALRARAIVRDLLSVVRKGEERKRERVPLGDLIERSAQPLRRRLEDLGTRFTVDAPAGLPALEVDPLGIDQVIANLVVNAAQAAGPGGRVRLSAASDGGGCEIRVEDDGAGIAPHVMPRLFEPFFSTKPPGQGTGLGLSVSRGIVEHHGGTVTAANREGGGACFVVRLPRPAREIVAQPAAAAAPAAERPAAPPRNPALEGSGRRLLIVDDEPAIRRALKRWFERRGWTADEASDGQAALERLLDGGGEYALIISDLKMPGLSGIELHRRLRAERPHLLRRLLFSTGDLASPEAARFLGETSCPVLEKPFEFEVLAATAARLCAA